MAVQLSEQAVSIIDWVVVWLSGMVFLACLAGAGAVLHYGHSASPRAGSAFNYLWSARICFQVAAACSAASQILRLQVLWGPESVLFKQGDSSWPLATTMCRVYVVVEFGLLEPVTLLLALFACVYSVQSKLAPPITAGCPRTSPSSKQATKKQLVSKHRSASAAAGSPASSTAGGSSARTSGAGALQPIVPQHCASAAGSSEGSGDGAAASQPRGGRGGSIRHPNFNIVFFALGFTLPACTAQLVCALFTRIFDLDYTNVPLFRVMFSTYDTREADQYCPVELQADGESLRRCAWCVFPVLSTLVSGALVVAVLLALLVVTRRIATAAVSRVLTQRIKVMQVVVAATLLGAMACRGLTSLFRPFDLGFELLRLGDVLLAYSAMVCLSWMLVWRPVRDAQVADSRLRHAADDRMVAFGNSLGSAPALGGATAATSLASGPGALASQPMWGHSAKQGRPPGSTETHCQDKEGEEAASDTARRTPSSGAAPAGGTFWRSHPAVASAVTHTGASMHEAAAGAAVGSIALPTIRSLHSHASSGGGRRGALSPLPHPGSTGVGGGAVPAPGAQALGRDGEAPGTLKTPSSLGPWPAQQQRSHPTSWTQEPLSPLNAAGRAQAEKQPLVADRL